MTSDENKRPRSDHLLWAALLHGVTTAAWLVVPVVTRDYKIWGDAWLMQLVAVVTGLLAFQSRIQRTRLHLAWAVAIVETVALAPVALYLYYVIEARLTEDADKWLASPALWVAATTMLCATLLVQLVTIVLCIRIIQRGARHHHHEEDEHDAQRETLVVPDR